MVVESGIQTEARVKQTIGKRIIVIGSSNAGKSTLAEQLAQRLHVPFIELDALYWEPGWAPAQHDVFRERVRDAIEPESWVMAGNYTSQQQDVSWPAADTIIWLDLKLATLVRRCVRRTWRRSRSKDPLWGGTNRENLWEHLMLWNPEKSLITFTIKTHRSRRKKFEASMHDPIWSHLTFTRLRSVKEIDAWLDGIESPPTSRPQDASASCVAADS